MMPPQESPRKHCQPECDQQPNDLLIISVLIAINLGEDSQQNKPNNKEKKRSDEFSVAIALQEEEEEGEYHWIRAG